MLVESEWMNEGREEEEEDGRKEGMNGWWMTDEWLSE